MMNSRKKPKNEKKVILQRLFLKQSIKSIPYRGNSLQQNVLQTNRSDKFVALVPVVG